MSLILRLFFPIMARGNNYTVQQVLQRLRFNQFDVSCDGDEEIDLQYEDLIPTCNAEIESFDSDTDSSKDEQNSAAASIANPSDNSSSQNVVGSSIFHHPVAA